MSFVLLFFTYGVEALSTNMAATAPGGCLRERTRSQTTSQSRNCTPSILAPPSLSGERLVHFMNVVSFQSLCILGS